MLSAVCVCVCADRWVAVLSWLLSAVGLSTATARSHAVKSPNRLKQRLRRKVERSRIPCREATARKCPGHQHKKCPKLLRKAGKCQDTFLKRSKYPQGPRVLKSISKGDPKSCAPAHRRGNLWSKQLRSNSLLWRGAFGGGWLQGGGAHRHRKDGQPVPRSGSLSQCHTRGVSHLGAECKCDGCRSSVPGGCRSEEFLCQNSRSRQLI